MTKKQRVMLRNLLEDLQYPTVTGSEYDGEGNRKEIHTTEEIKRLLAGGSEYRQGWEAATARVQHTLAALEIMP